MPIRLDAVEFELKHTREHLAKLKFNYLELATKHTLLGRLATDWEQRAWTPAQVKALEATIQPGKEALRQLKEEGQREQEAISQLAHQYTQLSEEAQQQWHGLWSELEEQEALERELQELETSLGPTLSCPLLTVEEAKQLLDERSVELERTRHALESCLSGCDQHQKLLEWQQREETELSQQLHTLTAQVNAERERQRQAEGGEHGLRQQLANHWRTLLSSLEDLLDVHVEMVRPGQLLVTLQHAQRSSLPLHLTVCQQTGRLLAAHPGNTSTTPQRAWKDLCQQAIELNDIPWLIRAMLQRLRE